MSNYKIIIFDLGGIFLKNIFRELFKYLIKNNGADLDVLRKAFGPIFHKWKLSEINEREFWKRFRKDAKLEISIEDLMTKIREKIKADQKMIEYAKSLKKKFRLIAASNNTKELGHDAIARFKLNEIFEKIYLSCDIHLSKPDKRFFDYILKDINAKAEDCIFVDDRIGIVNEAENLGFKSILFESKEQLERDIKNIIN